jgi:predicted Zn-dependent peptidase
MGRSVNKTLLGNGIRIITKKMPHVRSVSMGVWVDVGARDETSTENGLSHFIEHMIFKGTRKRTGFQIAKEFDAIGGQTNAFTTMEHTCYHAKVMDAHLETMVDILSDIFLNSLFDADDVEKERPVILQEIKMLEDTPEEYVHLLLGNGFWGDNALGRSILGNFENILRFNSDTIKEFFRRFYQPECIVISAAGNLEHDSFVDLVRPAFESVKPGSGVRERATPRGRSLVELCSKDLEQVHLCLGTNGISITDRRRYALSLMNTIVGGNMSSRLFQEIRERRGLAYSVYSFISSHVDTGLFGVYAGIDPQKVAESIEVILNAMLQLKKTPVDLTELHNAIEFTKGNLLIASESTDNQMARLAQNEIHFGEHIPLKKIVCEIESVTQEEIVHLAQGLFQADQLALAMLGPVSDQDISAEILTL